MKIDFLLRLKLFCGLCGRSINGESGTSENGEKKYYYKCLGRKRYNDCNKTVLRKDVLEKIVIGTIVDKLSKPEILETIVTRLLSLQEQLVGENAALEALLKERRKNEFALQNILKAIEQGIFSNTTNSRLQELETQQQYIEQQIAIEKNKTEEKLTKEQIKDFFADALKLDSKMMINFLVDKIILYDDLVEIYFKHPIKNSPEDTQGFCFAQKTFEKYYIIPQRSKSSKIRLDAKLLIQCGKIKT